MKLINSRSIAILMGVYNGGKYLTEQFDSIVNQSNQNWTLYIRDDDSDDNSREQISKYCSQHSNFISIEDNKGNIGCRNNFHQLLKSVESDYYMFCDQDDIWLPQKIEMTLAKMQQTETQNKKPIAIFTDLKVVDSELNEISPSFWKYCKLDPNTLTTFNYLSVSNIMTGCTMMINKEACEISLPIPNEAVMHDCWISLNVVAAGGVIDYVKSQTVLYRQHYFNVIGATKVDNGYLIHKLKTIKEVIEQNKLNLRMIQMIKRTSIIVYLFHKILYLIKR